MTLIQAAICLLLPAAVITKNNEHETRLRSPLGVVVPTNRKATKPYGFFISKEVNIMPIYKMKGSKDGKQKYRVVINFQDNLGRNKQIQRVTYGSTEAKALEIQLNMEIKEKPPTSRMTVQMLYDEYSKAVKNELRESSYAKNTTVLKRHVLPYLKDTPLDKLTAPVIQNRKNTIDEGNLSIRTNKNIFSCFRALLNRGIKLDYLQTNILLKVDNFKPSELISHNIDYYTVEECEAAFWVQKSGEPKRLAKM